MKRFKILLPRSVRTFCRDRKGAHHSDECANLHARLDGRPGLEGC